MADSSSVMREYLVALGFKIDEPQAGKFDKRLQDWDRRATVLSRSLAGVAIAAQAMVAQFAYSMEKLYYASRRTDSAAGSIKALEYGAEQVGVGGDRMRASLESLARNLRANPGLQGLLNSLGVKVTGRDKADVLTDLVGQLRKMPFYVAQQYGSLFGIDPDDLFMLQEGFDEMKRAQQVRKDMAAEMGVDMEAAALAGKEYANQWREIAARAGLFRDVLAITLLPFMMTMAGVMKELLNDWTRLIQTQPQAGSLWDRFAEGIGLKQPEGVQLSKESRDRLGMGEAERDTETGTNLGTGEKVQFKKKWLDKQYDKFMTWAGARKYGEGQAVGDEASIDAAQDTEAFRRGGTGAQGGAGRTQGAAAPSKQDAGGDLRSQALFARLEDKYKLSPGTLDRLWKTETGRGANLTGPNTRHGKAKGHFQFIDSTAQDYDLDMDGGRADRDDLDKSARAAARYFSDLKAQFGGDERKAAAAYNWGPGKLRADERRVAAGKNSLMPAETRKYIDKVAPTAISPKRPSAAPVGERYGLGTNQQTAPEVAGDTNTASSVSQTNNINVYGSSDPDRAARAVGEEMRTSNADLIRNRTPRVQ